MIKQIRYPVTWGHGHKSIGTRCKQRNAGGRQPLWPQTKPPWEITLGVGRLARNVAAGGRVHCPGRWVTHNRKPMIITTIQRRTGINLSTDSTDFTDYVSTSKLAGVLFFRSSIVVCCKRPRRTRINCHTVYATNIPSQGTESAAKFSETHAAGQTTVGVGRLARKETARGRVYRPGRWITHNRKPMIITTTQRHTGTNLSTDSTDFTDYVSTSKLAGVLFFCS